MNFNKIKRSRYIRNLLHHYHILMCKIMPLLINDKKAVKKYYYNSSKGKILDLENPCSFSEKQQWYKLYSNNPLMAQCADKHDVRQYIIDCGYEDLLNEQYGVYDSVKDIPINSLPDRFVLKAAHASGWNLIVRDKSSINWKHEKRTMKLWLKQNIYWSGREWVYKNLKKRIVAEKYLEDESGGLLDYKFYCFNGKPAFLQVEVGRFTDENTRNFYDLDWNLLPFGKGMPHNPNITIPAPSGFEEMKKIAKDLCTPFSFVRVDLYQADGKIYFGELTFFPAGGAADFIPFEYDEIVGKMWDIDK